MSTIYHAAIPVNLADPSRQRIGAAQLFMGDNNSHVFTALVADTDAPEAGLRAGTVSGTALRADGVTVALEGTKGADVQEVTFPNGITAQATPCSVTLPQAAFAVPGSLLISIKLTDGTTATTVLAVTGTVVRTETDAAVDPGEIIPDLAELQAVAAEAMTAAAGSVRFDQAQTLTDAQKQQARDNIGAGTGGGEGAVRYDEEQTLTDTQKATARENIAAAGEADFEGVTGYIPTGVSGSTTKNGITIAADGTRVTISGTSTASLGAKYSSGVELTGYTATTLATWGNSAAVPVVRGQLYRLSYRAISGSISGSATINVYGPNEWRALASGAQLAVNTSIDFVAATDFVEIVGYIGNGVTTGNAPFVLEMILTAVNAEGHTVKLAEAAPVIAAVAGVNYVCTATYVTSLSFTPSATGICSVRFTSGTTPTVLTLPNTVKMPDWWTGVEASRTYEISIADGIYGVVTSWA